MKKAFFFYTLNMFLILALCPLLSHKTFSMNQNLREDPREALTKILDELIPMPKIKPIESMKILGPMNTRAAKRWMKGYVFENTPKVILMKIMSHLSLVDLEHLKKVSGFFLFAESRFQLIFREMRDAISRIYITPEDLSRVHSQENLEYFLKYYENMCQDFFMENGHFKGPSECFSLLIKHNKKVGPFCDYLKIAIALGHEEVRKDVMCVKLNKKVPDKKKEKIEFLGYIKRAILGDISTKTELSIRDIFRNPLLRQIDSVRKNFLFFARLIALKEKEENDDIFISGINEYIFTSGVAIEGIVQDWIGIPLSDLFEKQEPAPIDQQERILNHPKIECLYKLIKLNAQFSLVNVLCIPIDMMLFKPPIIIKNFIPGKKIATEYLSIMSKNFISFEKTPILFTCDALKEIVDLTEIKVLMDILINPTAYDKSDSMPYPCILSLFHNIKEKNLFKKMLLTLIRD